MQQCYLKYTLLLEYAIVVDLIFRVHVVTFSAGRWPPQILIQILIYRHEI